MEQAISPLKAPVRAVFFDAVGTLIHPDPPAPIVYAHVGRRFGSKLSPERIREQFVAAFQREEALDRSRDLRTSEDRERQRWRNIVGAALNDVTDPEACFAELFGHFARPEVWRCEPDAEDVLLRLARGGYEIGMASNYDKRLRSVVTGLPALRPVRHLVISSEVGRRKPAAEFFEAMTRAVQIPPHCILVIGDDRVNDYDGARASDMQAILFDPKSAEQGGEIARIHRLSDLQVNLLTIEKKRLQE